MTSAHELTRAVQALHEWWSDAGLDLKTASTLAQLQPAPPPPAPVPPTRREPKRKDAPASPLERAAALASGARTLAQLEEAAQRFAAEISPKADAAAPFLRGAERPLLAAAGHWLLQAEGGREAGPRLFERMMASLDLRAVPLLTLNAAFWRAPGRAPPKAEIALSAPFVQRAIAIARPSLLLLLGETASLLLGGEHALRLRERPQRYQPADGAGVDAIVTLDPAYLLLRAKDKAEAWADLQRLERRLVELASQENA